MEELALQFKGQTLALALPNGTDTTVGQLQDAIAQLVHVAPDAQRLFHSKRRVDVSDAAQLVVDVCDGLPQSPTLLLLAGASIEEIEQMKETQSAVAAQQHIRANRAAVSIAQRNSAFMAREALSSSFRFHNIEVLENFRDKDRARSILTQLANDRGILAVMEKHKWSVGSLAEMFPDGKVGVDPVCVLGLNQNKGQKILLRLRTDDLLGFRKYLSIKKVLFHELSHNVHSEHDSKFYQLMRQVERECDELDWTHSSGSSVGGGSAILPDEETSTPGAFHAQRLGGGGDRSRSRLLGEMQQPPAQTPARQLPIINGEFEDRDRLPRPVLSNESSIDDQAARPSQRPESSAPALASASEPAPTLTPVREQQAPSPVLNTLPDEDPDFPMSERERRVYGAMRTLQAHYDAQVVANAVSVLHKIVANIIGHPGEAKYRSIRKANRVFESRVGRLPECLEFLIALGFEEQSEALVLARDDPALLWIGRSTLEVMLPASA